MYDGSHSPIDENVANTKKLVEICKEHGMSLEAEVGSIGGEEDGKSCRTCILKHFSLLYIIRF